MMPDDKRKRDSLAAGGKFARLVAGRVEFVACQRQ
jgi:hypothetical protein